MKKQCKACNGVYETVGADGLTYFHTCPDSVPKNDRVDENMASSAEDNKGLVKATGKGSIPV